MSWKKSPEKLIDFFDKCIQFYGLAPRQMFGYPCAFLNNHMVCGLFKDRMTLRLNPKDLELFLKKEGADPFVPLGRRMKEYALIPKNKLYDMDYVTTWLKKSIDFIEALPPKVKKVKKISKKM